MREANYPFGMLMPGRTYSSGNGYRYGFNGKENDNDVKGAGNQQDYGMRIYDPRVGRFLSVDPLASSFPWNTPYSYAENDPVSCIDLDGAEKAKPSTVDMARGLLNMIGQNILQLKSQITVQTDKAVKLRMEKVLKQEQSTYAAIMLFIYKNEPTKAERYIELARRASPVIKEVLDLTPAGDVKVVLTGKNFQDQPQSRLAALGWLAIDVFGGEIFGAGGKMISKGSRALEASSHVYGKCIEFAQAFTKKYGRKLISGGAEVTTYEINIGKGGLIGTAENQLSNNGLHQFVEVTKDGKSVIFDNIHPEGVLKTDYISQIAGKTAEGAQLTGEELLRNAKKVKN